MNIRKFLLILHEELRRECVDRMEFCRLNNTEVGLDNLWLFSDIGKIIEAVLQRPEFDRYSKYMSG